MLAVPCLEEPSFDRVISVTSSARPRSMLAPGELGQGGNVPNQQFKKLDGRQAGPGRAVGIARDRCRGQFQSSRCFRSGPSGNLEQAQEFLGQRFSHES